MYDVTTNNEGNDKMITNEGLRPSITIEQMIQREVLCCMSWLVSTLADAQGVIPHNVINARNAATLCEQAAELAAPILDYEEAAIQVGWVKDHSGSINPDNRWSRAAENGRTYAESAEQACKLDLLDAYKWEVYEHWAVSIWLADKLQVQGERVDTDFAGLNIWARTATGQAISMDGCIQRIYADVMAPHTLDSVAPGA